MSTVFTKIIDGSIPATFVHRDGICVVFMSINPIAVGHALVVPIQEVDHWMDLDHSTRAHLFEVSHTIGEAQMKSFDCDRIGLIIAGYEVPHTHLHVIPTRSMADLSFDRAGDASRDELEAAAQKIRSNLS